MAIESCSINTPEQYNKVKPNLVKMARFSEGSKEAFAKKLRDFRQSFPDDSDDLFADVIWQVYENNMDNFEARGQKGWTREDFKTAISGEINKPKTEETKSKVDQYIEGQDFFEDDSDNFINIVYGTSTAKDKLLKDFNSNIVRCLYLDFDNNVEVSSIEQANDRILAYQKQLFNTILKVYRRRNIPITSLFEDGICNLNRLNYFLSDLKQEYNIRNLQEISNNPYMQDTLDALNALFILNNFDRMLVSQFTRNAEINHSEGTLSERNDKYVFNLGNINKNAQWRDDNKDIDAVEEVSNITKHIIESLSIPLKADQVISVNTLIKALAHHPKAQEPIELSTIFENGEEYLNDVLYDEYGYSKSLYDLINDSINDQINGVRNLYRVLASKSFQSSRLCKDDFRIYSSKLKLIKNIYDAIFSEDNPQSLYNIYLNSLGDTDINEQPEYYYTYVTQMLGSQEAIDSQEYERVKGVIRNITLKQKQSSTQTYYIDNKIGGKFSMNVDRPFINFSINSDNLHYDNGNKPSIRITVELNKVNGEVPKTLTITKYGRSQELQYSINGVPVTMNAELFKQSTQFLKEVLGFDFTDMFISKLSEDKAAYPNLTFKFAANVLYNYALSKKLYNETLTKDKYEAELKHYYDQDDIPPVRTDIKQISFTNNSDAPIKEALARTYDDIKGINRNTVQKDASSKQIASNGLDQIATKVTQQWSRSNKINSALNNFSINQIYEGQEFGRDYKGPNGVKTATAFTESENFIASFMYDYLNNIYGDGVIKVLPSVISDKSRIPKTKFNLDKESYIKDEKGEFKKYRDLITEEWMRLTITELGDYYKSIYDDAVNMWNDLSLALFDLASQNTDLGNALKLVKTTLDYNTNFQEFNKRLDTAVKLPQIPKIYRYNKAKLLDDIIHQGVLQAQRKNPNFELTSVIHYSARDGELKGNALLFDQLYRYGKLPNSASFDAYGLSSGYGTFSEFLAEKRTQYVADLLKDDCEILLNDSYGNEFGDNAYKNLKKAGWTKGDNVIFAKLTYNYLGESGEISSTINITNKGDLKNQYIYKELRRLKHLDAYAEVRDFIDIDSPYFSFDKFMQAITIYNNNINSEETWAYRIKKAIKSKTELSDEAIDTIVTPEYLKNLKEQGKIDITLNTVKDFGVTKESLLTLNSKLKSAISPKLKELQTKMGTTVDTQLMFEMNPELEKYQVTEYFLSSEYMNATVGTHINHPSGKGTLKEQESAAWGQQVKRNVSLTASKYKFALNLLDGIRDQYTIAVIEDDKDIVYNVYGKKDKAKPFDGATFCAITTNYLENKSLKGDKAGIDKKQFIHDYKANSGTGIIVKTAGFAITNGRLRDSLTLQRMNRKMLDIKYDTAINIMQDYNGQRINYGDMVYTDNNGNIFRTIDVKYAGKITINGIEETNPFAAVVVREQLTDKGWVLVKDATPVILDSNYQVWQHVFGGQNSITIQSNNINAETLKTVKYDYTENSCRQLAYAMNKVGNKISDIVTSQKDVDQVMKRHVIDYVVTEGAIKQGAANVNSRKAYFDDDYEWSTMKLNMYDAGIQLDAEHHADESTLSLMTQVLNVLGARGYSSDEAEETYQALRSLTKEAIKKFDLGQIGIKFGDPTAMQEFLTDIILQSIKTVGSGDGSLISALSSNIMTAYAKGDKITYELIRENMPISNPATFGKMISSLASVITKKCVRIKFPGSLSVLSPSNRIYKIYNGHLLSHYGGKLPNLGYSPVMSGGKDNKMGNIKMGRTYKFYYEDGSFEELLIDDPDVYWEVKDKKPIKIEENLSAGRDLATYGVVFSDGKNTYNMWDLDEVRRLYKEDDNTSALQLVLNNLKVGGTVKVNDGQTITIKSMEVEPYELIMTKIYETTFGLKKGDDIQSIVNNKLFFAKRLIENLERKVNAHNYDVELKVLNGNHVYLLDSRGTIPTGLQKSVIRTRQDGDQIIQIDSNNNKIRTLGSANDSIYIDSKGNEIIVTDNINFYIDNTNFAQIGLSNQSTELALVLEQLLKSDKAPVQALLSNLNITEGNIDVNAVLSQLDAGQKQYDEDLDILKRNLNNPDIKAVLGHIKSKVVTNLINSSLETHTAFLKSLKTLAARIPAQSHQSFMAMRVIGFDESGVNTAYVSRMQIWLQGSDFDIDKVSLLGFKFKDGKFIKWSPLFNSTNMELFKASEQLSFPTGNILAVKAGTDYEKQFYELLNKWAASPQDSVEAIENIAKIIKFVNKLGFVPSSINVDTLLKIINNHNTYFKNRPSKDALINFISTKMYNISADPINLIQGQSGVDEATGVIKDKAVQQPMHIKSKSFAPGSPQSKMSQLILTLSGKENTGIVASAMKNFEACSQYYYQVLANGTDAERERLLMNIEVLGKQMNLLANAYAKEHSTLPTRVREALLQVNNIDDAFLQFSALLSLSTDNAKDPTLAKINAGPQMMSLYNAGLMIGLDLNTLIEVMTSPVGWQINALMKSNVFNDTQGIFNIDGIFDYINNGPRTEYNRLNAGIKERIKKSVLIHLRNSYTKYKDLTIDKLNDNLVYRTLLSPRFSLSKALKANNPEEYTGEIELIEKSKSIAEKFLKDFEKSKEYYTKKSQEQKSDLDNDSKNKSLQRAYHKTLKTIQQIEEKIIAAKDLINNTDDADSEVRDNLKKIIDSQAEILMELETTDISDEFSYADKSALKFSRFRKALSKYKSFIRLCNKDMVVSPFNDEQYSAIETIKLLSHIANEQSRLRPILALNQSLPNDLASQFKFLRNFESIFKARLKEAPDKEFTERFKEWNDGSLEISFNKFMTDSLYREQIIEFYDEIKAAVNIFDIMDKSKHYFGYSEALNAFIESCKYGSAIYRESDRISKEVLNKYFNVSRNGAAHQKYLKSIMHFLTSRINNQFLLSRHVIINIPPGTVITENGNEITSEVSTEILLGTPSGNANFKYWMENTVIPALKNGYDGGVPLSAYYDIIEDLSLISTNNTFDKKANVVYALTENMMPKSDSERAVFKHYKDELAQLQRYEYSNIPVLDLLFYYNLIVNNGLSGQNTLTTLFEDIFAEKTNDTVNDYIKFYSVFDKEGNMELGKDYTEDELLQYIAPLENPEQGKLKYIRAYNPNTMEIVLLKQVEKEEEGFNEDPDYDFDNEGMSEIYGLDEEEESQTTHTVDFTERLNSSNYRLFKQYEEKSKYFTNNYYEKSTRVSLSGDISIDGDVITIKGQNYTTGMLVSKANANGHHVRSIDQIIIKKLIYTPDGTKEIIDNEFTLSRIQQILEENC